MSERKPALFTRDRQLWENEGNLGGGREWCHRPLAPYAPCVVRIPRSVYGGDQRNEPEKNKKKQWNLAPEGFAPISATYVESVVAQLQKLRMPFRYTSRSFWTATCCAVRLLRCNRSTGSCILYTVVPESGHINSLADGELLFYLQQLDV